MLLASSCGLLTSPWYRIRTLHSEPAQCLRIYAIRNHVLYILLCMYRNMDSIVMIQGILQPIPSSELLQNVWVYALIFLVMIMMPENYNVQY